MLGYVVCPPTAQAFAMNEAVIPAAARSRHPFRRRTWHPRIRVHSRAFAREGAKRDHRDRSDWLGGGDYIPQVGFERLMHWLAIKLPRTSFVCLVWVYALVFSVMVHGT